MKKMKRLCCGWMKRGLVLLMVMSVALSMPLPAAVVSADAAGEKVLCEDFSWVSFENMLQNSAYTLTSDENITGTVSNSALELLAKGTGGAELELAFPKMQGTTNAYFDFCYTQTGGAGLRFGLKGACEEVVSISHGADGSVSANSTALDGTYLNTKIIVRLVLNFTANRAVVNVYNSNGGGRKYKTVVASFEQGVDRFFVALEDTAAEGSGLSMEYLYSWYGDGTERAVNLDENPISDCYKTVLEEKFGYDSAEALTAAGYTFSGSDADGTLTVEDGYPKLTRLTANGGTITLGMPIPTGEELGYKLDGKIRASLTYELPTNQIMNVYQKWKSVDLEERVTSSELSNGILRRARFYLRNETQGDPWYVRTFQDGDNRGLRPLVMNLDFTEGKKNVDAEMNIPNAGNPKLSKAMRADTANNANLYALDVELRGGSSGAAGNYFKVITWKIEKLQELQAMLTEAVSQVDVSNLAPNLQAVTENLTLPTESGNAEISWKSMNPEVLSDSGVVSRPIGADAETALILSVKTEGVVINRAIPLTVKQGTVEEKPALSLDGGVCTAKVKTSFGSGQTVFVVFGQYRDERLVHCTYRELTFQGEAETTLSFDGVQPETDDVLRVFIWKDASTMQPLSEIGELTVE